MARLLDSLRAAIRNHPDTPAAIAARAGLEKSALSRLLAGKGLSVEASEKLAKALGMRVVLVDSRRKDR